MVRSSLSAVANQLESANHLANGEETQALGEDDSTSNQLARSQAAGLLEKVLGRLEDGAALDGLPQGLVEVLEGGNGTTGRVVSVTTRVCMETNRLRRAHLLGVEDNLASLNGNLAVVDGLRGLLCR